MLATVEKKVRFSFLEITLLTKDWFGRSLSHGVPDLKICVIYLSGGLKVK